MGIDRNAACPCGSGEKSKRCCAPVVTGVRPAADPVAVLRARYSAYAWGAVDFLMDSAAGEAAETDRGAWRASLVAYCSSLRLTGLTVVSAQCGSTEGEVHYRAGLVVRGRPSTLVERARYQRTEGQWRYTGGVLGDDATA
jgi:SEC-C motif-containing protein